LFCAFMMTSIVVGYKKAGIRPAFIEQRAVAPFLAGAGYLASARTCLVRRLL